MTMTLFTEFLDSITQELDLFQYISLRTKLFQEPISLIYLAYFFVCVFSSSKLP